MRQLLFLFLVCSISIICKSQIQGVSSIGDHSQPGPSPKLTVVGMKVLLATDNDEGDTDGWFGRPSMVVRNGIVIMTYKEGPSHANEAYGVIHQIMSDDYGETWTAPNVNLLGNAVVGMPTRPLNAGAPSGNDRGPSHGILTLTSSGRILCQMWSSDYTLTNSTVNNDGAHQCHSDDGGLTWSAVTRKNFLNPNSYTIQANTTFFGEGRVVIGDTIYCVVRDYRAWNVGTEALYIGKSWDDGVTWTLTGQISTHSVPGGSGAGEGSLEYVGNGRFISLLRPAGYFDWGDYKDGWITYSNDWGNTWSTALDITAAMGISSNQIVGRTIIKTRANLEGGANWWNDRMLYVFGFTSNEGSSTGTRRNTGWVGIIPENYDLEKIKWHGPFFTDLTGYDGGYGDFFWNPILNEIVFCSYRAPTSFYDASVKQYNITLTFE